ncbi:MAG: hypothetical protein WKF89_02155 [Chitinophagaceae bacterium]
MARLYVTYRHNDLELARQFVSALRDKGHHVTLDQDYLVLGGNGDAPCMKSSLLSMAFLFC